MEKKSLITFLEEIPEFRRPAGLRHRLSHVLLIVILANMSGCISYRAIGDFVNRHRSFLVDYFKPKNGRLPSFLTVRQVLSRMDYQAFYQAFFKWASQHIEPKSLVAIDGKSIRSTVVNYNNSKQDFIALVSAYCTQTGQVISAEAYQNAEKSEIAVVRKLLGTLQLAGNTYTFDALHCKKKPLK